MWRQKESSYPALDGAPTRSYILFLQEMSSEPKLPNDFAIKTFMDRKDPLMRRCRTNKLLGLKHLDVLHHVGAGSGRNGLLRV